MVARKPLKASAPRPLWMRLHLDDPVHEWPEDLVEPVQVRADYRAGNDDDHHALEGLTPSRPVDLAELGGGLADELTALLLRATSGLLLDGLSRRANLLRTAATPGRGAVSGSSPSCAPLSTRLACHTYLVSRCGVCRPHQRQYFRNSTRSGEFRLDFWVW
jgi:hypothetical protein